MLYYYKLNKFVMQKIEKKEKNVWLDCDPGLDDTLAIILAACHKNVNLIGISTSAGNTSL